MDANINLIYNIPNTMRADFLTLSHLLSKHGLFEQISYSFYSPMFPAFKKSIFNSVSFQAVLTDNIAHLNENQHKHLKSVSVNADYLKMYTYF